MLAMHRALESVASQLAQAGSQLSEIRVDGTYFKPFRDIPHKTIIGGDLKVKGYFSRINPRQNAPRRLDGIPCLRRIHR